MSSVISGRLQINITT